ncbi:hypothetical protein WJX75_009872 [Coccomyxa subellipsoidea]|uniref:Peptidase S8/S53 domain-containing protein n=1 Tax=Coccomyxa subellipsoidea TaxID=248742 RepID=A0ABR2Z6B0_9CHLO
MTALSPEQLCSYLTRLNPDLAFCERDGPVTLDTPSATPNDPIYPRQTNLDAIKVPQAWKTGDFGSQKVRVCIIDTGVDVLHPDLVGNLWMNTVEMNGPGATAANGYKNGIDDDGDGIVDNIYGANFNTDPPSADVQDGHGHGTHVAGVIGAVGNNGIGVTGISQAVTMLPCRFMDANGNGSREQAIKCMDWCLKREAHVLSNSWGEVPNSLSLQVADIMPCRFMDNHGLGNISLAVLCYDWCLEHGAHILSSSFGIYEIYGERVLKTAVATVASRGVVFVSSAGNDHTNNDLSPHWPSNIETDTTIAVAALDRTGAVWSGSNFGNATVDIAAPGENVISTYIGGDTPYSTMTGTSVAVPHVAGTAALLLAQLLANGYNISSLAPNKGYGALIKRIIMQSVDPLPGNQVAWGSLNTAAALKKAAGMSPSSQIGTVSDGAVTEGSSSSNNSSFPDLSSVLGALATFGNSNGGNTPDGPAQLDGAVTSGVQGGAAGGAAAGAQATASPPSLATTVASAAQEFARRVGGRNLRSAGGLRGVDVFWEARPKEARGAQPLR